MIPYVVVSPLRIGPIALQPFGALVALGMVLGIWLATRRAKQLGLDERRINSFITFCIAGGVVGAHVLEVVFYRPHELIERPWLLLMMWDGLSSFGGFIGMGLGAFSWKYFTSREAFRIGSRWSLRVPVRRARPYRVLPYADVVLAVFPIFWVFGRAGCAVVHDHPGKRAPADSLLAVAYGPGPSTDLGLLQLRHGIEPRYDLGLLEMVFAVVLAIAFALTWRRARARGVYVVTTFLVYAPVRFMLDFLRAPPLEGGDIRYGLLTPAQWACIAMFAAGLWMMSRIARAGPLQQPKDA